jgi:hypothetical protein
VKRLHVSVLLQQVQQSFQCMLCGGFAYSGTVTVEVHQLGFHPSCFCA